MANALYDLGREGFLDGSIDWDTNNQKASLLDSAVYTPNLVTDKFQSTIVGGGAAIANSSNLASKTVTLGVADAADVTWTAVTGAVSEYIEVWQDSGSNATSRVICLIDTATGLPVTPNGGDINVAWSSGSNRIFKL